MKLDIKTLWMLPFAIAMALFVAAISPANAFAAADDGGSVVIVSLKLNTGGNHAVTGVGATDNGDGTVNVTVRDPNDPENTYDLHICLTCNTIISSSSETGTLDYFEGGKLRGIRKME